jgi:hypothetical protein
VKMEEGCQGRIYLSNNKFKLVLHNVSPALMKEQTASIVHQDPKLFPLFVY